MKNPRTSYGELLAFMTSVARRVAPYELTPGMDLSDDQLELRWIILRARSLTNEHPTSESNPHGNHQAHTLTA